MIDSKRLLTLIRLPGEADRVTHLMDHADELARTTIKHRLSIPTYEALTECCDVVDDHLGFMPDRENMSTFLWLHPKLKSRVIEFSAGDTEVRSELIDAVCTFTTCVNEHIEAEDFHQLVVKQWQRIWGS